MKYLKFGGRVGVVVRALAFHQCGPGSISEKNQKQNKNKKKTTFDLIWFDL